MRNVANYFLVIISFCICQKIPKTHFLFHARLLEDERLKHWIRGKWHNVAILNYCSKDNSVANMEEAALTSYMKGKKYVERSPSNQRIESLMPPTPSPLWSFWKSVCLESGISNSKFSPWIILKISLSGVWTSNSKLPAQIMLKISFSGVWDFQL